MADLKLTPARLEVLKAIEDGEVNHHRSWGLDPDEDVWRPSTGGRKKVNGSVAWLKDAGLINSGPHRIRRCTRRSRGS